ncbi:MAG: hypothetical protein A2X86_06125 [Bdellovibrionales bacterium GWA2_49_15]|nr:MAG: hypothetical protein A2X86_06125 [Bdellovibrionales bacterium GWA2_49_15]HAZ14639.1 hypothetical protein [Bdellovibrionales bacterium]
MPLRNLNFVIEFSLIDLVLQDQGAKIFWRVPKFAGKLNSASDADKLSAVFIIAYMRNCNL